MAIGSHTSLVLVLVLHALPAQAPSSHQVLWQRSLEDAQAIAKAEDRPLFLAVNMDGESASERIVRELYRDPAFVAATRSCVCLVASVFRHTPRDYDDDGRRIPCPRLGEVTCGEHMALEPLLHQSYLTSGERVAPRHALVLQNGDLAWDMSLSFDLRDIERQLAASVRAETERRARDGLAEPTPPGVVAQPRSVVEWLALARRRDQRGRSALEAALWAARGEAARGAALAAIANAGDAGSVAALRILCARLPDLSAGLRERFVATVRARGLDHAVAAVLRDQIRSPGRYPGLPEPSGCEAALPILAELDGQSAETRALLLACRAFAGYGGAARRAVRTAFGPEQSAAIESAVAARGGALSVAAVLRAAAAVGRVAAADFEELPRKGEISDAMPAAEELERVLDDLDVAIGAHPDDAGVRARHAKASLDLARRRIEEQGSGAEMLLEDAARGFRRALEQQPEQVQWRIEAARTAYFQGRFDDQAAHGRRALRKVTSGALPDERALAAGDSTAGAILDHERAIEALRWIGDADARLLAAGVGGDPASAIGKMLEGARALGVAAASPFGTATDWTSVATFCRVLGLRREELAFAEQAALRLPVAAEIRKLLNDALWAGGRVDLAADVAEWIASQCAASGDVLWFSGYAWVLEAENERRGERPAAAIAAYATAQTRFASAAELRPQYAETCAYYTALSWLGRGMAQLLAGDRAAAADALVEAVTAAPGVATARDGLDRDALDLVDQCLEWRESGPSPVEPLALLDRLEAADPNNSYWAVAIADAELREALRADGRNPVRVERDTVDAGGQPIRMPMGLPTGEGDAYLRASITAARRALRHGDAAEARRTLAQSDTIWAERMLVRDRLDGVAGALAEAAPLMGAAPPDPGADAEALRQLAGQLREMLGEARPRLRPGR